MSERRIVLVASRFRDGGVERWMNRLAAGFLHHGIPCDYVLGEQQRVGASALIPRQARVSQLSSPGDLATGLKSRLAGLQGEVAVLVFRSADYGPAVQATRQSGGSAAVQIVTGTYIGQRLDPRQAGWFRAWKTRRRLFRHWAQADGVIAVSSGVADDWRATGAFAPSHIHAPPPPVVEPDMHAQSRLPLDHPWDEQAAGPEIPLFVGVGRLTGNKRFDDLIRAFSRVRRHRPARLAILGQGPDEGSLRTLARSLGIDDHVAFPGFVANPYPWMRQARALVLPSEIEPFGFVLIESLAVGTPFIATRGPAGPAQIRKDTGQGMLIPLGDTRAMADVMEQIILHPVDSTALQVAVEPYALRASIQHYLTLLFPWTDDAQSGHHPRQHSRH